MKLGMNGVSLGTPSKFLRFEANVLYKNASVSPFHADYSNRRHCSLDEVVTKAYI
jgi:hypothetical protein